MSKTINQALADLVTGLGESSSILADNKTVSDYIADVEKAIKDYAGSTAEALIDDTASSEAKTYSSSKISSLIPSDKIAIGKGTMDGSGTLHYSPSSSGDNIQKMIDVRNAISAGKIVVLSVSFIEGDYKLNMKLQASGSEGGLPYYEFMDIIKEGTKINCYTLKVVATNAQTLFDTNLGTGTVTVTRIS